ncbi:amidohydrolase family protein [Virgibacillus alimentarius]|uniref:amidohydrolase family protein n=1 Tax=Virgibacillus alimentarius TaxID=698769 RepID=UPI0004935356|nr:amidohydrolase family protein [Virgibacillus alimentarius]
MNNTYVVRARKIVTVTDTGTINDGAMVINGGKITSIGQWSVVKKQFPSLPVVDYSDYVLTPSLVDCHTHLLEFAPSSLYPITAETQILAGKSILLNALTSGITALGEQVCGHPMSPFSMGDYRSVVKGLPMDISFAAVSISIGFSELAHFSAITKSKVIQKSDLIDPSYVHQLAKQNEYPGENLFINATPANFTEEMVPRAGEMIYSLKELKQIVTIYHQYNKKIGVHVAGEEGIQMCMNAGVDVLHHAHGISDEQIEEATARGIEIIATPLGGTHLEPNSPENIAKLVQHQVPLSIATDAYLPSYPNVSWLPFPNHSLQGTDVFMKIAQPGMKQLAKVGYGENEILALITANPAAVLGKENQFGQLKKGMDGNFLITKGIPGLEITDPEEVKAVYFKGKKVINRIKR